MSIERYITAQEYEYPTALAEMRAGQKSSHWIWFIFPQLKGLGRTSTSDTYGIDGLEEAREYLANDLLRERLIEISEALLEHDGDINFIMGSSLDAKKLRSSMTLFKLADDSIDVFGRVLDKFFSGKPDYRTISMIKTDRPVR